MEIKFNRESILESLHNYRGYGEHKFPIENSKDVLSEKEQDEIINEVIMFIETVKEEDFLGSIGHLKRNKNGSLRSGSVTSIYDIDIADYVTDFTNCWYHDRIALRAIGPNECQVVFERTQTTSN